MNPIFNICNAGNSKIRIQDVTQEAEEYIPEDINNVESLYGYYSNNRFKYSQTYTINILLYNTEEPSVVDYNFTDHQSYLDEAYFDLKKDGYYTVQHYILPSVDWLRDQESKETNILDNDISIYVTDGNKIYYYKDGELEEKSIECFSKLENVEDTTISKLDKNTFSIYYIYNCYINTCKQIFNRSNIRCLNKNTDQQDLNFKRDFLQMTINVLKYYTELGQLNEAQRLLSQFDTCNTFCSTSNNHVTHSGCGCNG